MAEKEVRLVYCVAPYGNDANHGDADAPLASIREALIRLRGKTSEKEHGEIRLFGGVYRTLQSITIDALNSFVFIKAMPGERPVFDGSVPLDSKNFAPLEAARGERYAAARRVPAQARKNVWTYDLKSAGIGTGRIYKNGFNWPLMPCSPELVANGKLQTLARYPKDKPLTRAQILIGREIKGRENKHTPEEHERYLIAQRSGARQGGVPRSFYYDKCDEPKSYEEMLRMEAPIFYVADETLHKKAQTWLPRPGEESAEYAKHEPDAFLTGYFENNYADDMSGMCAYDPERRLLYLKHPVMQGVQDFWLKLRAINVLSELAEAGEYYIDREDGHDILYYCPEGGTPAGKEISLTAMSDPLFSLKSAKGVNIGGLVLQNGTGLAMELTDCEDCVIEGCEISNFALDAVHIGRPGASINADPRYACAQGGKHNRVLSCFIHDMGGGGVLLSGGDRMTLTRAEHLVKGCVFEHLSNKRTYSPAICLEGCGSTALYNRIAHSPHMSMHIMGNDMLIEGNRIEDVCRNTSDQGAIYAGRCYTWLGNVICGNIIRGVGGRDNHGIYLDDGMSGMFIRGNIFEDISGHCLFLNSGHGNTVEENVFLCENSAIRLWGFEETRPVPNEKTLRVRLEQITRSREAVSVWLDHYRALYPFIDKLYFPDDPEAFPKDENCLLTPAHHVLKNNIVIGGGTLHNAKPETLKYYSDSFGEPLYRFNAKSEAFADEDNDILRKDALGCAGREQVARFNQRMEDLQRETPRGRD